MNTTTHPATNRGESLNPLDNIDIIDITYRETSAFKMSGRPVIKTSEDIIDTCLHYWNTAGITEGVIALFLNESYKVLELYPAFEGKFTETSVDPVRIIEKALGTGSYSIVIARKNNLRKIHASEADRKLGRKLKEAVRLFDLSLYNYLVIGSEGHRSFTHSYLFY